MLRSTCPSWRRLSVLGVVWLVLTANLTAGPYDALLKYVPEQANALLLVNLKAARTSPVGVREHWGQNYQKTSLGGVSDSRPAADLLVAAMQLNPSTLEPAWEISVVELERNASQAGLVKAVGGSADSVGGQQVVLAPQNAYYAIFAPRVVGMMRPANRQSMARWIKPARPSGRVVLAPYLQEAVKESDPKAQAVMAVELADVFDEAGLRERLKSARSLSGKGQDLDQLTRLFAGLKGCTLSVRVGKGIDGELRLDFSEVVAASPDVVKGLVLEAMDAIGAGIQEMDKWQARPSGKTVVLHGPLTTPSVRQLLSPLFRPAATNIVDTTDSEDKLSKEAAASLRYFRSITTLINDLRVQNVKTYNQLSYWYKQFAEKIETLPMLNVDEDLLKFGAAVATTLRGLANLEVNVSMAQKHIKSQAGTALVTGPTYNYMGGYSGYSYYGGAYAGGAYRAVPSAMTVSNYGMVNNMLAATGGSEAAIRNQTWKNIDDATLEIRRQLTKKYQVEFN